MIPITIVGEWVKGHYTGKNRRREHDLYGMARSLVADHLESQQGKFRTSHCPTPHPGYAVRMLYDNSVITSKFYSTLATLQHEEALRAYILRKTKCKQRTFDRVDWKAHHLAFNNLTVYQKISTAKLIHNPANTNRHKSSKLSILLGKSLIPRMSLSSRDF
jgi:hypothetical protein